MSYIKDYKTFLNESKTEYADRKSVMAMKSLSDEQKKEIIKFLKKYSRKSTGRISGLLVHPEIIKKAKEKGIEVGFDMGIDNNGYYIHTHRARSKSHKNPSKITVKDMKFINSTG